MKNEMKAQEQKKEFRQFLSRKSMSLFLVICCLACGIVAVSADEITPVTATDWQPVVDALTAQISVSTVVAVLAVIVAACVGLAFMWWGLRKAVGSLMSAFKKGKVSV